MNERIKEIYLECYRPYSTFDYDKFAELIVRKCAELADEPTSRPYESYGEKIRKNFGVD